MPLREDGEPASEESSPEEEEDEGRELNLEDLATSNHPCLEKGRFSIFNHPNVGYISSSKELIYAIDLDGVVVLSRFVCMHACMHVCVCVVCRRSSYVLCVCVIVIICVYLHHLHLYLFTHTHTHMHN